MSALGCDKWEARLFTISKTSGCRTSTSLLPYVQGSYSSFSLDFVSKVVDSRQTSLAAKSLAESEVLFIMLGHTGFLSQKLLLGPVCGTYMHRCILQTYFIHGIGLQRRPFIVDLNLYSSIIVRPQMLTKSISTVVISVVAFLSHF